MPYQAEVDKSSVKMLRAKIFRYSSEKQEENPFKLTFLADDTCL
jgi:hypothetical protein